MASAEGVAAVTTARGPARAVAALILVLAWTGLQGGAGALDLLSRLSAPPGAPQACSFRVATGFPCMGCGGTHALALMAQGDMAGAVRLNPLGACAGLAAWLLVLGGAATVLSGRSSLLKGALALVVALWPAALVWGVVSWWWALP